MSCNNFKKSYNEKIRLGESFFIFNQVFLIIALLGFFYLLYLQLNQESEGITCIYKTTLGKECPTCGFTRSFLDFLSLKFQSGINRNPASIYYFTFALYFSASRFGWTIFTLFFQKEKLKAYWISLDIVILISLFLGIICFTCYGG
jgi:hypothetical protein